MALVLKDRVKETTTTTSTGTYTLAGAVTGYQAFSVIGDGNTTYYAVTDGTDWEVGIGTYTSSGTTLSRDSILESSNSGNAVNWGAGIKDVFCTYPAERSMYVDGTTITPAISARLGFANLAQGSALSVLGVTGNSTADVASIAAGTDNQVLRRSGTSLAFGSVNLASTDAVTGTLAAGNGGTGNAFFTVSGPASSIKTYTFPNENMTVVGTTQTQTLTNKTITQRVSSTASISSPLAFNSDNFDLYAATAQAGNLTINADAGTPTDGQKIIFRFTCDGTARTITFTGGASKAFKPVGANLTAAGSDFTYALTINKTTYFGCVYNTSSSRWEVVALSQEA